MSLFLFILQIKLLDIFIVSGPEGGIPDDRNKELRMEDRPSVYVILKIRKDGRILYTGEPERGIIKGRRIRTEKIGVESLYVRLYEVRAEFCNYYNDFGGRGMDTINYVEKLIEEGWSYRIKESGTWRFKAEAIYRGDTLNTPGKESRWFWGIKPHVHRVSVRRSDDPVGWAESRKRLPYIWGNTPEQAYLDIGTDCADFVAMAYERAYKKKLLYPWTQARQFCPGGMYLRKGFYIVDSIYREDNLFFDSKGNTVRFKGNKDSLFVGPFGKFFGPFLFKLSTIYVERGDILVNQYHTTMLYEDKNRNGVLDADDLMIETLFDCPDTDEVGAWDFYYIVRYRR